MNKAAILLFSIMALGTSIGVAQPAGGWYEIGTWRGFRPAAISYTFDDNQPNQYRLAVPMFNSKGFKITLFTVTTWVPNGSWAAVQQASLAGNEVGSHTATHPKLAEIPPAQQLNELERSQTAINANVKNAPCVTVSYPYCSEADESITAKYYIAARGCSGQLVPSTPPDFMNISSFACGTDGAVKTADDFNETADRAVDANSWCVYLIYAIDDDKGYSPLSSATLQASVNYLSAHTNLFWVETFGNVARYIKERNAAEIQEVSQVGDQITLQVTHNLDKAIYNYPITLRRTLPAGWPAATVSQNSQAVGAQLVTVNSVKYVMFDVVPNGGDIVLTKVEAPAE